VVKRSKPCRFICEPSSNVADEATVHSAPSLEPVIPTPPQVASDGFEQVLAVAKGDSSKRRVGPVLAAGLAAFVTLALAGWLALSALGGADIDIDGPTEATVGQTIFLRPDVPADARSHSWTVAGQTVTDADLQLTPASPGAIDVVLNVILADGSTDSTTHRIAVS